MISCTAGRIAASAGSTISRFPASLRTGTMTLTVGNAVRAGRVAVAFTVSSRSSVVTVVLVTQEKTHEGGHWMHQFPERFPYREDRYV